MGHRRSIVLRATAVGSLAVFLLNGTVAADFSPSWTRDPAWHADGSVRCLPADANGPARVEIDTPTIWAREGSEPQTVWWRPWIYQRSDSYTGYGGAAAYRHYESTSSTGPVDDPNVVFVTSPAAFWGTGAYTAQVEPGEYWVLFEYWWQPRANEGWIGPIYQWAGSSSGYTNYFSMGDFSPVAGANCDFRQDFITLTP